MLFASRACISSSPGPASPTTVVEKQGSEIPNDAPVAVLPFADMSAAGDTIRVTAQPIDAVTDRYLWSNTYDRPLTTENLSDIQDDVANSIFEALNDERGLSYGWLGQIDEAISDFEQCARYEPYYTPCLDNLHYSLVAEGRDDEALRILKRSMDAGLSKVLYLNLGLLARTGNELAFKAATNHVDGLRDWRHHHELYVAFQNLDEDHSELATSIAEFFATNPGRSE
jgi:tetratricopeptide (TPR) repeat protein